MNWREHAACKGQPLRLFYDERHAAEARALCAICSVSDQCLADADNDGIWGGLLPDERSRIPGRRAVAECGTESGYQWHRRHLDQPCQPCRDAHAAARRDAVARGYKRPYNRKTVTV